MTHASPIVAAVLTTVGVPQPVTVATNTKSFKGGFLLYRKNGDGMVKPGHASRARNPRFRHPTFAAAEAEAKRLLPNHPDSTFIILQEVARVKVGSVAEPKLPKDGDDASVFEAHAAWVRQADADQHG